MTADHEAMLRTIAEANRAMDLAIELIQLLHARVDELEIENERLRRRCAKYAIRLRMIEEGEL